MCCGTPGAEPRTAGSDDCSHPSVIVPRNVFESHSAVGRLGHQRHLAEVVDLSRCWLLAVQAIWDFCSLHYPEFPVVNPALCLP